MGCRGFPVGTEDPQPYGHPDHLSIHLSMYMSNHLSIHSLFTQCIPSLFFPVTCMFIFPSIHPPTPISIHQFIHLHTYPFSHPLSINSSFNLLTYFCPSSSPFSYPVSIQLPPTHHYYSFQFILSSHGFIHLSTHSLFYLFTCYFSNLIISPFVHLHT